MADDRLSGTPFAVIPVWILKEDRLSSRAVHLYAVLYRYVGENDVAWPLQSTLAKDLQCSLTSLKVALGELVDVGAVEKKLRFRGETREIIGCLYEIIVRNPKGVVGPSPNPSQPVAQPLVGPSPTDIDTLELDTTKSSAKKDYTPEFLEWWKIYLKPVDKKKTFGCWNATLRERGGTVESLMLSTHLFADEMLKEGREKQFIMNSTTFLGPGERWREYLPESIDPEVLALAWAWDAFDSQPGPGTILQPDFPRPQNSEGNLLDGEGRAYYRDPMQPTKRRYLDDE